VIKDLIVDRNALDRIISLGYTSVSVGSAPETNAILVSKQTADLAMNAAPVVDVVLVWPRVPTVRRHSLPVRKVSHLALLFQGHPERNQRVVKMVAAMDAEGFGNCTMHRECQAVCPKGISVDFIARMNREYLRASLKRQVKDLDTTIPHSESS